MVYILYASQVTQISRLKLGLASCLMTICTVPLEENILEHWQQDVQSKVQYNIDKHTINSKSPGRIAELNITRDQTMNWAYLHWGH